MQTLREELTSRKNIKNKDSELRVSNAITEERQTVAFCGLRQSQQS